VSRKSTRDGQTVHHIDIVLQGENETVFFDV
jgi:protocatechuate 3,4-dioxygenase beta subunit